MSTNNKVTSVLVTAGNQAVLPAGQAISTLGINQIGVFDANTKLSIDGSTPSKDFFLAVGRDNDGDTVMDDIDASAGQLIQRANLRNFSFRPHTPGRPMIFTLTNYVASCDTEYGIRLEFRNMDTYLRQGFVQYSKPYFITTSCCTGCETCPTGDNNEITQLMKAAVNADLDNLVTVEAIARQAITIAAHGTAANYSAGDVMTDADVAALIVFNAGETDASLHVFSDLEFTTVPLAINSYCSINLGYKKPRFTVIIPSKTEGFDCTGVFTTTQEPAAEEGAAYDVKQKEYHAGPYSGNPGPYRVSVATGTAYDIIYRAVDGENYDQFALEYDQLSVSGWQEHLNNLMTTIAIPAVDTVTRNGLAGVFDALFAGLGFDALADDVATADVDPTVEEPTSAQTEATDGIA